MEKHLWIKHNAVNQTFSQDYPIFPFGEKILHNILHEAKSKLFIWNVNLGISLIDNNCILTGKDTLSVGNTLPSNPRSVRSWSINGRALLPVWSFWEITWGGGTPSLTVLLDWFLLVELGSYPFHHGIASQPIIQ